MSQATTIDELRREFAEACGYAAIVLDPEEGHAMFDVSLELHEKTAYWLTDDAKCCVCGCTEDCACEGGCWWIDDPDLLDRCSQCEGKPVPDRDAIAAEAYEKFRQSVGNTFPQRRISNDSLRAIDRVIFTFGRLRNDLAFCQAEGNA